MLLSVGFSPRSLLSVRFFFILFVKYETEKKPEVPHLYAHCVYNVNWKSTPNGKTSESVGSAKAQQQPSNRLHRMERG